MVEYTLVAENERLRRENAELRERVETLERCLEVFGTMLVEGKKPGCSAQRKSVR